MIEGFLQQSVNNMKTWLVLAAASFWLAVTSPGRADTPAPDRPRLLVLTDFFKDPDDKQSLIRLLTYANEFEIEGLIATSLAFGTGEVRPDLIKGVIDDYAKVFPNLREHGRPGYEYPAPDSLKALVKAVRTRHSHVGRSAKGISRAASTGSAGQPHLRPCGKVDRGRP